MGGTIREFPVLRCQPGDNETVDDRLQPAVGLRWQLPGRSCLVPCRQPSQHAKLSGQLSLEDLLPDHVSGCLPRLTTDSQ